MRSHLVIAAVVLAAACGKPPPPPPPDPPRVNLVPVANSVADTQLEVTVNVSGCESVSKLEIFDGDKMVFPTSYAGSGTKVQIPRNAFTTSYAKAIAADLSLTARAVCADGRENRSTPASVRYFPVDQVVRAPVGGQIVTDVFFAEGSGANTTFIGCSGNGNGTTSWVRVDRTGAVTGYNAALPFPCSIRTWLTERNLATGKRWAVEPGVGAFAFDADLNITAFVVGNIGWLGVGPDGDAVIFDGTSGAENVKRISHENGAVKWTFQPAGKVISNPVIHPTLGVYLAEFVDVFGQFMGDVKIERVDYGNGLGAGGNSLRTITYGLGDAPAVPPASFNVDGSILFFPYQTQDGATTILACATNADGCNGTNLKWQAAVTGNVVATVAYSQHSILAAVAPQFTTFVDARTGAVLNKNGTPISPEGALVTMGVQPGLGSDFYILNGSGQPGTLPVEIIGVDSPGAGELFRYSLLGSSIMAGVDEGGELWLRVGADLVKPMPLAEYQLVRQR